MPPSLTSAQTTTAPLSLRLVYKKILTHITTQLSELLDQQESPHHRVLPLSSTDPGHRKLIGGARQLGIQGHDALPPQHTQGSSVEFPREEASRG